MVKDRMRYPAEHQAILNAATTANALLRDWFARAEGAESRDEVLGTQAKQGDYSHLGYEDVFTLADQESEDAILHILRACRDIPVVSEESNPDCANWPDGTQRWLVDPIDGTSQFKSGSPNFSVTIALQTKTNGVWTTDIGLVSDPLQHCSYVASEGKAQRVHENGHIKKLKNTTVQTDPMANSRRELLGGKKIENVIYSKANTALTQSRYLLNSQLEKHGAKMQSTYSTAIVMAKMTTADGPDALVMAGNAFDYAWDTDAAIHIAQTAGIHAKRFVLDHEPVIILAKDSALIPALRYELRTAYSEAQRTTGENIQR